MVEQPTPLSLTRGYDITADGCDAARRLPPATLVGDIISLAVGHADRLGVGYAAMEPHGIMWVMGRMSIEVERWPAMFDRFDLTTWVEGVNRLFSERNFELTVDGRHAGYARTIWSAIDTSTRRSAQLTPVATILADAATPERPCPIDKAPRLGTPSAPSSRRPYTFGLSDLDFNRHVTTTRYIDLITDCIPLDLYDRTAIRRMDVAFHREARYGDTVDILSSTTTAPDGSTVIAAAITASDDPATIFCASRLILG